MYSVPLDSPPPPLSVTNPEPPLSTFSLVVGPAGTGKTTLVREWADGDPDAVLCATTGIAAINLGGITINSLLGYYDTASLALAYDHDKLQRRLRLNRMAGVHWYLLDEISMLSGAQLDLLVSAIEEVNRPSPMDFGKKPKPIRLTLIGDFAQLPPINEKFAFESQEWDRFQNPIMLTDIRRQTDQDFVEALQAVRRGDSVRALQYFADKLNDAPQIMFEGTTLKARNEDVDHTNELRLDLLEGKDVNFAKSQTGEARGEWKQIPHNLNLKIGALVMILANKRYPPSTTFEYVNGDLGYLVDAFERTAYVKLLRNDQVVQVEAVQRLHEKPIDPDGQQAFKVRDRLMGLPVSKALNCEVVGAVTYMPLRAAWASTVHKSQGLSLDSVQVDFRNRFFAHPGMLYVALSRARSPHGLRLVGTPHQFKQRCTVDPKVIPWL